MFALAKKEKNAVKLQEVIFQKSQKLLASQAHSSLTASSSYITHLNGINSHWTFLLQVAQV